MSTSSVLTFNITFPITEKEEKHTVAPDVCNSVGMHLLLGCVDLVSATGKLVPDCVFLMQIDPTLGILTLHKFLGILLEMVTFARVLEISGSPSVLMIYLDHVNSQISLEITITYSLFPFLSTLPRFKKANGSGIIYDVMKLLA